MPAVRDAHPAELCCHCIYVDNAMKGGAAGKPLAFEPFPVGALQKGPYFKESAAIFCATSVSTDRSHVSMTSLAQSGGLQLFS